MPNIQKKERERREKFCRKRGISLDSVRSESLPMTEEDPDDHQRPDDEKMDADSDYHRSDEQVRL